MHLNTLELEEYLSTSIYHGWNPDLFSTWVLKQKRSDLIVYHSKIVLFLKEK